MPTQAVSNYMEEIYQAAIEVHRMGRSVNIDALFAEIKRHQPEPFLAFLELAGLLERFGNTKEALGLYEKAIRHCPGNAHPATRRAFILLQQYLRLPPEKSLPDAACIRGRVRMSTLGSNGRFGNQLIQYGFLRIVAQRFNLVPEIPYWIGRHLFDLNDSYPSHVPLTPLNEKSVDLKSLLTDAPVCEPRDSDLIGYFNFSTGLMAPYRDAFRSYFQPCPPLQPMLADMQEQLRQSGDTVVALHLRRGDFGYGRFWIAPEAWYLEWLEKVWPQLRRPVLYIATDDPGTLDAFRDYRPLSMKDFDIRLPGAEFFPDFYTLTQADLLAASNSSFSITASMLNKRATQYFRPQRETESLQAYDPWNTPLLW